MGYLQYLYPFVTLYLLVPSVAVSVSALGTDRQTLAILFIHVTS